MLSMSKKLVFVSIFVLVIIAGVAGAIALGYGYAGVKQPYETVTLRPAVCDGSVVDTYNAHVIDPTGKDMTSLVDTIEHKANYQKDPTCVFIALQYHMAKRDVDQVKSLYTTLADFQKKGEYVDNKVANIASLSQLNTIIDNTFNPTQGGKRVYGSG